MFWHSHMVSQIVWMKGYFSLQRKEKWSKNGIWPQRRIAPHSACFPSSYAAHCRFSLCNVLNNDIIIDLADILHCQKSKQYTGGWRNGLHTLTYIILMWVQCKKEGRCWDESVFYCQLSFALLNSEELQSFLFPFQVVSYHHSKIYKPHSRKDM